MKTSTQNVESDRQWAQHHAVVVAHAWYEDLIGGSFRLASEFAIDLASAGCRVSYVCCAPSSNCNVAAEESVHGVRVYRYPPPRLRTGWGRLRYHVRQTQKLVEEIDSRQTIAALCGHSPLQYFGAMKVLRKRNCRKTFTVHSPFDDELATNYSGSRTLGQSVAVWLAKRIDRCNLKYSDKFKTDSQYTLDVMRAKHGERLGEKGRVAPGWVDSDRFRPVEDRAALRRRLGGPWDTAQPVFFTLRRLEQRMGLDTLIAAAARLRPTPANFRVILGGSGSLREPLEQQVHNLGLQDMVFFVGRIEESALPDAYAAADCFVLPTRALECFGLIVLEAFACGTPVIASRVAAIPEIAGKQGDEWLFEPGSDVELAEKIKQFLAGTLSPHARLREIAEEYDRRKISRQWAELALSPCKANRD